MGKLENLLIKAKSVRKFLLYAFCLLPLFSVQAEMIYSAQGRAEPNGEQTLSDETPFYIAGNYVWSQARKFSFDAIVGGRIFDVSRLEANYHQLSDDAYLIMGNVIFDARIDQPYRIFRKQWIMPYVGFGGGVGKDVNWAASALAGISVEFNKLFALDFGYRYLYLHNMSAAHQARAGVRVSF